MKKTTPFEWNDQADEDFRYLKRMLSTAIVLAAPAEKEPLLLYIAATSRSVSTVMVVERPEKDKVQAVQRPVYYLSEVLAASKHNYPHYQKMCQDASGRVAKWALELADHTILYEPRTMIKSQALADFLVDWTETQYLPPPPDSTHWRMHFDGSKMRLGLGASIVLSSPKGDRLKYELQIHFASNNCSGEWDAHNSNMASYRFLVQKLSGFFAGCEFLHVPRAENEAADTLAKIASSRQSIPSGVSLEHLHKPSVKPSPDSESIHFLENGVLPMDETDARQVQRQASAYNIINNELVKRSCTGIFQRRVEQDKGIEILLDIHQGECGHHAASRSLVAKAFRHGFYWPTALEDAESLILKCEGCQCFSKRSHQPASALRTIPIAWPFAVWGLDMVGPFKTARGARPIKKLDGPMAVRFVKDIAVRYGMPNSIITDNGTNFAKGALAHWLDELPAVLWSLRTTPNQLTGFTPFFLVYRAEAVILTDVEFDSPLVTIKKIKPLTFREGDLVLRLVQDQTVQHKLSSPWEGPFIVSKALCDRNAYYLIDTRKTNKRKRDTVDEETTRPWNAELLRPFYS
ncbi:uncharacterized protein [Aegilops tauschii subsp. strangulata]|uniref:uncharacterized protein n=1 Tax=Aegilops tauschii subsp. strangulata TaxID=200361 RepID=UPI003CC86DE9